MSVSVSIIVRNSSDVLERCLESVKDADEIVIVDTGSIDNTKEIALKYTNKVYDYYGCNEGNKPDGLFANFADARNRALSYCTKTHVLTIDSDEYLVNGAMDVFKQFKGNALSIRCINETTKEEHRQPRLHINHPEIYWKGAAHNYLNCGSGEKSNIVIMYGRNRQKKTDPNRTMRILERWVKKHPLNNTRELYYLGREYHKRGMFRKAIKIFNKYVIRSTFLAEKAEAFVQVSRCYAALGFHEKAINSCLAAINLNPMFGEALRLMGDLSGNVNRLKYHYLANKVDNNGVLFIREDNRIKVTILSVRDFAGSGYRIAQSVRIASKGMIDIECITEVDGSAFGIITGPGIEEVGYDIVKERIQSSDIIHFKGDWPHADTWPNINVNPMPKILENTFVRHSKIETIRLSSKSKTIYTVSGSLFRKKKDNLTSEVALELFPLESFKADFLSSMEPDLCYTKEWHHMPYPYLNFNYTWKKARKFRIIHIPSTRHKKGSDMIDKAIELLKLKRKDIEYICKTGISFEECLKLKSSAHLYIDQMIVDAYGNSAVEAMAFGIPVLCGIDKNLYADCPVIVPNEITAESVAKKIDEVLNWDYLQDISLKTYNYCKSTHGSVGQWWLDVYKELAKIDKVKNELWAKCQSDQIEHFNSGDKVFSNDKTADMQALGDTLNELLGNGTCLDVGCGILPKPVYMQCSDRVKFNGIDPFLGGRREFDFIQGKAEQLPYDSNSFDGVLFASSLDHIQNVSDAIKEALRVSRKYIIIWGSFRNDNDAEFVRWQREGGSIYNHINAFSVMTLSRMIGLPVYKIIQLPKEQHKIVIYAK